MYIERASDKGGTAPCETEGLLGFLAIEVAERGSLAESIGIESS